VAWAPDFFDPNILKIVEDLEKEILQKPGYDEFRRRFVDQLKGDVGRLVGYSAEEIINQTDTFEELVALREYLQSRFGGDNVWWNDYHRRRIELAMLPSNYGEVAGRTRFALPVSVQQIKRSNVSGLRGVGVRRNLAGQLFTAKQLAGVDPVDISKKGVSFPAFLKGKTKQTSWFAFDIETTGLLKQLAYKDTGQARGIISFGYSIKGSKFTHGGLALADLKGDRPYFGEYIEEEILPRHSLMSSESYKDKILKDSRFGRTQYQKGLSEKKLVEGFIKTLRETPGSAIIGYNIEQFDIPYLKVIAKRHNLGDQFKKALEGRQIIDVGDYAKAFLSEQLGDKYIGWQESAFTQLRMNPVGWKQQALAHSLGFDKAFGLKPTKGALSAAAHTPFFDTKMTEYIYETLTADKTGETARKIWKSGGEQRYFEALESLNQKLVPISELEKLTITRHGKQYLDLPSYMHPVKKPISLAKRLGAPSIKALAPVQQVEEIRDIFKGAPNRASWPKIQKALPIIKSTSKLFGKGALLGVVLPGSGVSNLVGGIVAINSWNIAKRLQPNKTGMALAAATGGYIAVKGIASLFNNNKDVTRNTTADTYQTQNSIDLAKSQLYSNETNISALTAKTSIKLQQIQTDTNNNISSLFSDKLPVYETLPYVNNKYSSSTNRQTDTIVSQRIGLSNLKTNSSQRFMGTSIDQVSKQGSFSGRDDAYNIIEGLRHNGMATDARHSLTEFGSGYLAVAGAVGIATASAAILAVKKFHSNATSYFAGETKGQKTRRVQQEKQEVRKNSWLRSIVQRKANHFGFSGADDNYNTIPALQDRGFAYDIRSMTEFGSGYKNGLRIFGQDIDPKIQEFRDKWFSTPEARKELKKKQQESEIPPGDFKESELQILENGRASVDMSKFDWSFEDPDTLTLKRKGLINTFDDPVKIRMAGIDSPEIAHPGDPTEWMRFNQEQPYGEEATKRAKDIWKEKSDIKILVDPSQRTYGRYVGLAFSPGEEEPINLQMVRKGIAAALPFGESGSDLYPRKKFIEAEKEAISNKEGMWGEDYFKRYADISKAVGRRITFNSFTDLSRLAQNYSLAAAEKLMSRDDIEYENWMGKYIGSKLNNQYGPRKSSVSDGIHPGVSNSLGAASVRGHSEFGSGWDPLRKMAKKIFGESEGSFAKMIKSEEFQTAISGASSIKELGFGAAGGVHLMEGVFKGQKFKFAKKSGLIFDQEVAAMRAVEESVGPTVYAHGNGTIAMEYFEGKFLGDLPKEKLQQMAGLEEEVASAFGKLHEKGYRHGDTLGNVMLVNKGDGKEAIALIDFGAARKLSEYDPIEALRQIRTDIDVATDVLKVTKGDHKAGFGFTPSFMSESSSNTPSEATEDLFDFLDDFTANRPGETLRKTSDKICRVPFQAADMAGKRHIQSAAKRKS
jgi:endonuclease YncB( thermonuclease family)/tRNA A-37 threonylcarbamoyl transferase component Bud32